MWSGRVIPVSKTTGQTIFAFFSFYEGTDIIKTQEKAMAQFELNQETYNYWLGEWRFVRR